MGEAGKRHLTGGEDARSQEEGPELSRPENTFIAMRCFEGAHRPWAWMIIPGAVKGTDTGTGVQFDLNLCLSPVHPTKTSESYTQ